MSRSVESTRVEDIPATNAHDGSLCRALRLMRELSLRPAGVGVSELSRRLDIPKPSVYRMLRTMRRLRFVREVEHVYFPGEELRSLARALTARADSRVLREVLTPVMVDLHREAGLPVKLTVLRGHDVVVLQAVHGVRAGERPEVGRRMPAHSGAGGRVLLAFAAGEGHQVEHAVSGGHLDTAPPDRFDEIRRSGVSVERPRPGWTELAAPVFDHLRRPVAALVVSGPTRAVNVSDATMALRRAAFEAARLLPAGSELPG
ncbi:IclR family transcriptional regulator [Actinopolyspora erythraea]|nr:helix-turn-helix domain-containing protein [Actinopolyspora erythraea]